MKTKRVKTDVLKYATDITIIVSNYENNNNIYIGIYNNGEDELYNDITVNIMPLSGDFGYVLSTDLETLQFIEEQHIGNSTGIEITQGFNTYTLYQFNIDDSFTETEMEL